MKAEKKYLKTFIFRWLSSISDKNIDIESITGIDLKKTLKHF